jgi:hypothetical protein
VTALGVRRSRRGPSGSGAPSWGRGPPLCAERLQRRHGVRVPVRVRDRIGPSTRALFTVKGCCLGCTCWAMLTARSGSSISSTHFIRPSPMYAGPRTYPSESTSSVAPNRFASSVAASSGAATSPGRPCSTAENAWLVATKHARPALSAVVGGRVSPRQQLWLTLADHYRQHPNRTELLPNSLWDQARRPAGRVPPSGGRYRQCLAPRR